MPKSATMNCATQCHNDLSQRVVPQRVKMYCAKKCHDELCRTMATMTCHNELCHTVSQRSVPMNIISGSFATNETLCGTIHCETLLLRFMCHTVTQRSVPMSRTTMCHMNRNNKVSQRIVPQSVSFVAKEPLIIGLFCGK